MENLTYKVIKNREQYDDYCNRLENILFSDNSSEKQDEIELLTLLIETFDAQQREEKSSDPITLIKALMEEHKLNQNDLAKIVRRSKGYVSEMLNRKKALSKDVIRILAYYFKISQESLNKEYVLYEEPEIQEKEEVKPYKQVANGNMVSYTNPDMSPYFRESSNYLKLVDIA